MRKIALFSVVLLVLACQVIPTPPPLKSTPLVSRTPPPTSSPEAVPVQDTPASESPTTLVPSRVTPSDLSPFPYQAGQAFAQVEMAPWEPEGPPGADIALPVQLEQLDNLAVTAGLTIQQRQFLAENGFVAVHSREAQFSDIRQQVSAYYGQPYYLTSDAAYHALHLAMSGLTKSLEQEQLRPRLVAITQAVLEEVVSYLPLVQDTFLEVDTRLAAVYLGVGLRLLDSQATLDPSLEQPVSAQVEQILAGGGLQDSVLIPGFRDNFEAYQPVGHYAEGAELESYFRAMSWFGRAQFKLQGQTPGSVPSRAPLIVTLALRRATSRGGSVAQEWARLNEILTFLAGPSNDYGPAEYAVLMDQVYGNRITVLSLSDALHFETFVSLAQELPPPGGESGFTSSIQALSSERGWRFIGQRFGLDAVILHNLVFDMVGTREHPRNLPSGLDVMAVLGSPAATQALEQAGETAYLNYPEQMTRLQKLIQTQTEVGWLGSANTCWFYAALPQVAGKSESYPAYMRSPAWAYKDMNSALGGWAELSHDRGLLGEGDIVASNGQPASGPAPGYVEPNPPVFYRLAYLASVIAEGLEQRGMDSQAEGSAGGLGSQLRLMQALGALFRQLGDIAAKELAGTPLAESDYRLIQAPLGLDEERVQASQRRSTLGGADALEMPPVPVIGAFSGIGENALQVGVGRIDRIYVIVPLDGKLKIAQGGVFAYYEFAWPVDEPLSNEEWRQWMSLSEPDSPRWVEKFRLPGGAPVDVLAFRVGDIYYVTQVGIRLNLRQGPSRATRVVRQLRAGDTLTIIDGPEVAEGFTWWKFRLYPDNQPPVEGWAVESQEWYERAWGQ